ncbi:MAG: histidinol-phosphatase [Balneolaceae bacterium]
MDTQLSETQLLSLRKAAESVARLGGNSTLKFFRKRFQLEFKKDDSPVTDADRGAEQIMREAISEQFPEHGIIGEEFGEDGAGREIVWVLDPIDGTQSFIHGIPFYTTLIGILINGRPEVGVIYAPALDEMVVAATGTGTLLNGRACSVRDCNDLSQATFLTTDTVHVHSHSFRQPYEEIVSRSRLHRTWGDAYGHLMVATGRADLMFDPVLSIWDAAALLPVVTEAGGHFSDVYGEETIQTGNAISCSKGIRDHVLNVFNRTR